MFGPNVTSPSTPDVTASIMMIVATLGRAPHMLTSVTSFLQTVTEEPIEVTSVVSKLVSLLNSTEFTSKTSDLPPFSTTVNGNVSDTTEYNSSFLIDTTVVPKEPALSSELITEFGDTDNFIKLTVDNNLTFSDKLINVSSHVDFSEVEEDLLNSSDGIWNMFSSDIGNDSDISNNTILSMENITFKITEKALETDPSNVSSEEYLDDTTDMYINSESFLALNSVTVANLNSDEDSSSSSLASVTENELLTSTLITTLTALLAQEKESSSSSENIEKFSQILQEVITDIPVRNTDPTKCDSTQCNTMLAGANTTIWEPSVTVNSTHERQFSTAITLEPTVTLGKTYGRFKINTNDVRLAFT
jgi:hypothetical protein